MESELFFKGKDQNFSIFTNFAKSRATSGAHQSRRPDLSYGLNYSKNFSSNLFGTLDLYLNYKYTGEFLDWDGSKNSFQKSTDLVDMSITKNLFGNIISLNITNLLDENYEKPATYSQEGRKLRLGFKRTY